MKQMSQETVIPSKTWECIYVMFNIYLWFFVLFSNVVHTYRENLKNVDSRSVKLFILAVCRKRYSNVTEILREQDDQCRSPV